MHQCRVEAGFPMNSSETLTDSIALLTHAICALCLVLLWYVSCDNPRLSGHSAHFCEPSTATRDSQVSSLSGRSIFPSMAGAVYYRPFTRTS